MHETGLKIVNDYMKAAGLNIGEMANRLGITYQTFSKWIHGNGPHSKPHAIILMKEIPRLKYTDIFGPEK